MESESTFIMRSIHIETNLDKPVDGKDLEIQYLLIFINILTIVSLSFCEFYEKLSFSCKIQILSQ